MIKKILFVLFLVLFFGVIGCNLLVRTKPIDKSNLSLQDPSPLKLRQVEFVVVTESTCAGVFNELKSKKIDPVIFGLTGTNYKNLAENTEDIKNYLILQKAVTTSYRNYYETSK